MSSATSSSVGSRGFIVRELLTKDNYEEWSVLVKNYLMGRGLWDIVESNNNADQLGVENREEYEIWRRQNAEALHIIQLTCESGVLSQIKKDVVTAKDAWNRLKASFSEDLQAIPDVEQGGEDDKLQLHRYVESGNWAAARYLLESDRTGEAIYSTSSSGRTVLHVAVISGHEEIVRELAKRGKEMLLKMKEYCRGYTALALAADITGNTKIAESIINECQELLTIGTKEDETEIPLLIAAASGDKQMTRYLFCRTPHHVLIGQNSVLLFTRCIAAEIFDVALCLLQCIPELLQTDQCRVLQSLHALSHTPSAFPSGTRFGFRRQFIYRILILGPIWRESKGIITNKIVQRVANEEDQRLHTNPLACRLIRSAYLFFQNSIFLPLFRIQEVYDEKLTHHIVLQILRCFCQRIPLMTKTQLQKTCAYDSMLQAAKNGITEFIDGMMEANPDLLWTIDKNKRDIFSHAVLNRRKEVFKLIHKVNGRKEIIKTRADTFGNNLLHLAGHLGPSSELDRTSGAALQMQRELQWFEEVEKLVHPKCKQTKNKDNKKPHEVFTQHHADLVKAGEKWAKDTASSFILVGILITTIMFAAAFTVPGGNDQKTGTPTLSHNRIFDVFAIADAVSLFTSTSSVLVFSGILTSRYAEKDFRCSLPWKLMLGLVMLFSSVVAMIVAFCAAVGMMLKGYPLGTMRTIMGLASIPVIVLVPMQFQLFLQFFGSTVRPLFKEAFFKCFVFLFRNKRCSWARTPYLDV